MTREINTLSLFSGIGGLDIGFHRAGFNVVAAVEWDRDCCATLRANLGSFFSRDMQVIEADITTIAPEDITSQSIDFVIGGPPCQTFSAMGRRAGGAMGTLDDRGNLFEHYCRLLDTFKPKGFLFENVRGILSSHKGRDWQMICSSFEELGFTLKWRIMDAAGFGVAQHRERLILVGFKEGEFFFPCPTHGPDADPPSPYPTPRHALRGLAIDESGLKPSGGKYDDLLADVPPGMNYLYYTKEMSHPEPRFAWRSKFSDFLYKAHPEQPVKTIVASMGRYSGPFHWDSRKLAIAEFKRLQGIPDDFILSGGKSSQAKQIGNSVVPPFAERLALAVRQTIFGVSSDVQLLSDASTLSFDRRKGEKARRTRAQSKFKSRTKGQLALLPGHKACASCGAQVTGRIESCSLCGWSLAIAPAPRIESAESARSKGTISCWSLPNVPNGANGAGRKWTVEERLHDGVLRLGASTAKRNPRGKLQVEVLLEPPMGGLRSISSTVKGFSADEPFVAWDAINVAISKHTSYPSIHELYGHFTEPNPAFRLNVQCDIPQPWVPELSLLVWFSDFQRVNNLYDISLLTELGFEVDSEGLWLKRLRNLRFDIRTHETNPTIPPGMLRCCYPYTMPFDRLSFVSVGKHEARDSSRRVGGARGSGGSGDRG